MEFEIKDEQTEKRKHKMSNNKKLIYLSIFFLFIAVVILITYFIANYKPEKVDKPIGLTDPGKKPSSLQVVDDTSKERPLAIMINNSVGENMQAGLQGSYINYEILLKNGNTGIMAVYKDKSVNLIGPIEKSENYFLDYSLEHDSIYVYHDGSDTVEKDIQNLNVKSISCQRDIKPFAKDPSLQEPYNIFTSTDRIRDYLEDKSFQGDSDSWKVLNYSTKTVMLNKNENGEEIENSDLLKGDTVTINYSSNQVRSYTYEKTKKYYLRLVNDNRHLDKQTGKQLTFKNIIIMKVENEKSTDSNEESLKTTGNGTGYYVTNGYAVPINWAKSTRYAKTIFTYKDGTEVKVNDGNTFIHIVPSTSSIVIE